MNCEQARLEAMDGRSVDHVRECAECAAFVADYRRITGLLNSGEPLPMELREKLSTLGKPRRLVRLFVAAGVAAAAAVVIALPMMLPSKPVATPPKPSDSAQLDAELELIRRDVESIDLKARMIRMEAKNYR